MGKHILKIVLTGGPCGGKSTALSRIERELTEQGYKVIVISETATELISNGVWPWEDYYTSLDFQNLILNFQLQRESLYELSASSMKHENIIIVCDRGAMDNKAYLSGSEFDEILSKNGLTENIVRDSYDAIFHLQTAAEGAEKFYTLENNAARKEDPEQARQLDKKIISAWTGHPLLRIIDNSTDFEQKINRLMAEVFRFLGKPVPLKFERKFLISMPDVNKMLEFVKYEMVQIMQTYLISDSPNVEKRIRQRGIKENYTYLYTTQKQVSISTPTVIRTEKRISEKEYLSLLTSADISLHQIRKNRYCFVYNNLYFELDIYPFWNDVAILEIKLTEQNQELAIPSFIQVIREVTDDMNFKNYSIARAIPSI